MAFTSTSSFIPLQNFDMFGDLFFCFVVVLFYYIVKAENVGKNIFICAFINQKIKIFLIPI